MAYNNYYRSIGTMGLNRAGQQGELTRFNVNQYRAFIKHILALTTSQRLAYDPIATNSDSKSQEQANLARDLLDYYCKEKKDGALPVYGFGRSCWGYLARLKLLLPGTRQAGNVWCKPGNRSPNI
jgi:hypothetical protein